MSVYHQIFLEIIGRGIPDKRIMRLLKNIIESFDITPSEKEGNKIGLPLGNLTSQLFANVYMNEFDQWVKHRFRKKYYIRYADDYIFLSDNRDCLRRLILVIEEFLQKRLKLSLHPKKIFIKTITSGIDFLGWINFFNHRILRRATKKRMLRRANGALTNETLQSYLGLLRHGNTLKIKSRLFVAYGSESGDFSFFDLWRQVM